MIIPPRNNGMGTRPWLARFTQLPRLTRLPLGIEITLALLLKIALLALLWNTFFSAPQTKKMRMPTSQVEQHVLTPPKPQAASGIRPELPSSAEAIHDSNR